MSNNIQVNNSQTAYAMAVHANQQKLFNSRILQDDNRHNALRDILVGEGLPVDQMAWVLAANDGTNSIAEKLAEDIGAKEGLAQVFSDLVKEGGATEFSRVMVGGFITRIKKAITEFGKFSQPVAGQLLQAVQALPVRLDAAMKGL